MLAALVYLQFVVPFRCPNNLWKWILAFVALFYGFTSSGAIAKRDIPRYHDQLWQVADGLPSAQVRAIVQSSTGYLWLGTLEGLARFDGIKFTTIERRTFREMRAQLYIGLAEDHEGGVWFSNGKGLSRWQYDRVESFNAANGLPSSYILFIQCTKRGELFVGTEKGIRKYINGRFVPLAKDDPMGDVPARAMLEDRKGDYWFGTASGLFKYSHGEFTAYTVQSGHLRDNSVLSLAQGSDNRIWIGTGGGLTCLDQTGSSHITTKEGLLSDTVRALLCDSRGNLWIGTTAGMMRMMGEAPPILAQENISLAEFGPVREIVYTFFEDSENNIWVGTNRGLIRLKPERFRVYSVREGLPHKIVNTVYEDTKGRVWFGTANGLARSENGKVIWGLTVKTDTTTNELPRSAVYSVMEDDAGDLWFGTQRGLFRAKEDSILHYTREKSKLADNVVRCMLQLNSKNYFFGNNTGLTRYRFQLFTNFAAKVGLPFTDVKAMVEGKEGRIWVGSEEGLTVFLGETFKRYTMKDGLSSEWVNALYIDKDDTLWIGTENGGLDRFKDGKFVAITPAASGIFSERIYSIIEDDFGNLWMGSRHGIFRANRKELNDYADGKVSTVRCISYGQSDGLRSIQCTGVSQPAAWKGNDGRLWFATTDGVAFIDSHNLPINSEPPKIVFQRLRVDGQPMTLTDGIHLMPGKGNIEFEYTAICLQAPEKTLFKYKLEGVDSDWMDVGDRRIATYANLSPGNYRFNIRACNNDGVWTESPASFAFTLEPHFYQAKGFYLLLASLVAFAAAAFHSSRLRVMAAREKELSDLVAKRTEHLQDALKSMETFTYSMAHDLRGPLRAIRGLTRALTEDYQQHFDATAIDYAKRIEKSGEKMDELIRDLLVYGQLSHSKVSVEFVDLENSLNKVRTELEAQLSGGKAFIEVKSPLINVRGNAVLLQQVLINLLSNALKFVERGKRSYVIVWTERRGPNVRICIRDNGIGIDKQHQERIFRLFERLHGETEFAGTGVGLAIVRKAVERMNGAVGVESSLGNGSCFWVELPEADSVAEP